LGEVAEGGGGYFLSTPAPVEVWREPLPWLLWGEITQVGKDTSKGNGVYRLRLGEDEK